VRWAIGDLIAGRDVPKAEIMAVAALTEHSPSYVKDWALTAAAWPRESRIANWKVHSTLRKLPNRFEVIRADMGVREATALRGGNPLDQRAGHKLEPDEKVDRINDWLEEEEVQRLYAERKAMTKAERMAEREAREAAKRAWRAEAEADLAAKRRIKEKRDQARQAELARDPEAPWRNMDANLTSIDETLRAVGREAANEGSFLSRRRVPDILNAYESIIAGATEAMALIRERFGIGPAKLRDPNIIDVNPADGPHEVIDL
jgi:hypothetical protein